LAEWEDKFKKCMISNEQLDNEKSALSYKLDLVQDKYDEQEEKLFEGEFPDQGDARWIVIRGAVEG
jgi:hypothetical protein